MSSNCESIWELFLDESGEFLPNQGSCQIAGILVDASSPLPSTANLRPALRLVFPGIKYPPHASQLSTVPGYLGCWLRAGAPTEGSLPVEAFGRCRDLLLEAKHGTPAFDAWREFAAGKASKLAPGPAWLIQEWLELRSPTVTAEARHFVDDRQEILRRMLEAFLPSRRGRLVVVASHELTPSASAHYPDWLRRHRYLVLLAALLERIVALLGRPGGRTTVRIRAGDRALVPEPPRHESFVGDHIQLGRWHLEETGRFVRAAAGVLGDSVDFDCAYPEVYDRRVHPGVAVADFVSHGTYRSLGDAGRFEEIEEETRERFGLSAMAESAWLPSAGPLPAVTACGSTHAAVMEALHGRPPVEVGSEQRGWAKDQANRWISAIDAARERTP